MVQALLRNDNRAYKGLQQAREAGLAWTWQEQSQRSSGAQYAKVWGTGYLDQQVEAHAMLARVGTVRNRDQIERDIGSHAG